MKKKLFLLSISFLMVPLVNAQADILELRIGAGPSFVSPDDFNNGFKALSPDLEMEDLFGYNVDAFANIPGLPFGAGVRFEQSSDDAEARDPSGFLTWDLDVTRYALLLDYRPLDNVAYAGAIASVGTHSADFEVNNNGNVIPIDLKADGLSFTIGAEGGVKLKGWILGAELGYQSMKFKKENTLGVKLDLTGTYGKLLVGRAFF
jgi:hypothetical protein